MLEDKIKGDQMNAMKAKLPFELGVLRMITSALKNFSIEKKSKSLDEKLSDEEVMQLLSREVKKRLDASELYIKGGRIDLADSEKKEADIIQKYLPPQISEDELNKIVESKIKEGLKDFPSLMKDLSTMLKGRIDGRLLSEIIKKKLSE